MAGSWSSDGRYIDNDSGKRGMKYDNFGGDNRRGGYNQRSGYDKQDYNQEPVWPTEPPFTAYVGNLPRFTRKNHLDDIFEAYNPVDVRVVYTESETDADVCKGFAYVQFETLETLKTVCTEFNGAQIESDTGAHFLKVNPATNRRGGRGGGRGGRGGRGDSRGGRGGRDNDFGGRGGRDNGFSGRGGRDNNFGGRGGRGNNFGGRGGRDDSFGGRSGYNNDSGRYDSGRDSRGQMQNQKRYNDGDSGTGEARTSEPSTESASSGRPKLNLLPRTVKDDINEIASKTQQMSIFGGAKPRDEKLFQQSKSDEAQKD